jgi:2-dehydropantoate 2-reductase
LSEKIVVYGAGAIGGQVGALMHAAGHDVTIVEPWAPQLRALLDGGLTIHDEAAGPSEHFSPPAIAPEELAGLAGPIDVLFLAVKSFDTMASLEAVLPYLAPDGLVVSMQNSNNEEWIGPVVGNERMVGGVILINAVLLEPGHVTLTSSVSRASTANRDMPGVYVGEYLAPVGANATRVAGLLNSVWPARAVDDLMHERWSKLATNTMINTVSAISGLRSAEALATPSVRKLMIALAAESLRVAEAEGHLLETLLGDYSAVDIHAGAMGRSNVVDEGLASRAALVSAGATTSMLQDVLRDRQTEVDFFSGLTADKGLAHGIPTPFCLASTAMVHRVEAGLAASVANVDEVIRLVGE